METWKYIPGYEGKYKISNHGRVKSLKRKIIRKNGVPMTYPEKIMKQQKKPNGYMTVMLYGKDKPKRVHVHRLVGKVFVPNPEGKPQINHLDGDKENNYATNLIWVTAKENCKHAYKNGFSSVPETVGALNGNSKLTEKEVLEIFHNKNGKTQIELAAEYDVSRSAIENIHRKKTWTNITASL